MSLARVGWSTSVAHRWPEWWVVSGVVLAWAVLVTAHLGHLIGGHHAATGPVVPVGLAATPAALGDWLVMSMAMMTPITIPAVRHVALNSVAHRRTRAMVLYLVAYALVWVAFGMVALSVAELVTDGSGWDRRVLTASSLAFAGVWQLGRPKRRALLGCRRTVPLRPYGLRADAACLRFGVQQGLRCLRSCWALMWLMAVLGHGELLTAIGLTAFITLEELTRVGRRLTCPVGVALLVAAVVAAVA